VPVSDNTFLIDDAIFWRRFNDDALFFEWNVLELGYLKKPPSFPENEITTGFDDWKQLNLLAECDDGDDKQNTQYFYE